MDRCPLTKEACGEERCFFWMKLTDYEGCPFDIADQAIQDFKTTHVLPLARKADKLVTDYLKGRK